MSIMANILFLKRHIFAREPDREGGASARSRCDFDSAAVRASYAPDSRQPQSRAVWIRAEERTEDPRQICFGDATAVVFDFDHHFPARPVFTVAFSQSHDHGPVSVYGLDGVGEQPMRGGFDLRRVNSHDDRSRVGDEFDLDLPALRRASFRRLIPGERDRPVDGLVHGGMPKVKNRRLRAIEHGLDDRVYPPYLASDAFEQLAFGVIRIAPSNQN